MLLVRRPKTPAGFNGAARGARATVREIIKKKDRPSSDQFIDKWGPFKNVLAEAQHHRCGYCDRKVLGGDDGTVDHFRPKAEIEALLDDPATWGTQKAHSASLRERATELVSDLGYHWLAYAWSNYVFACSVCNEKWKRALFPVATHPRCCPPRPCGYEEPLLLCCYSALRPSDHIQFNADGTVEPWKGSSYGYETIRTVGLYREALCDERKAVAEDVFYALGQLAEGDEASAIPSLKRFGNEDRPFAGVARAMVEQNTGMLWEDFLVLYA